MVFRARSNEWVPFMSCMSSTVYIKKIIWVMNLIIQGNTLRNRNKHALVKNDFILRCRNVSKFFFSLIRGQKWSKAIQERAEHQSACMWWLYIATKQGEVRATISFAFAEEEGYLKEKHLWQNSELHNSQLHSKDWQSPHKQCKASSSLPYNAVL